MSTRASEIWDEYVKDAPWLIHLDGPFFLAWCNLTAMFEDGIPPGNPHLVGQWRGLGNDLGLNPSARAKLNAGPKNQSAKMKKRDEIPDAPSSQKQKSDDLFAEAA